MFIIQTKNVQHLKRVIIQLNEDINESIKKSDSFQENMRTNLLALTYSAWSEAQFIQIIYTPNAFDSNKINTMLRIKGIFSKWEKLIKYAFEKIEKYNYIQKNQDIQILKDTNSISEVSSLCLKYEEEKTELLNKKNKIIFYLKKYIEKPSRIRNKIAHGQWINPLLEPGNNSVDECLKIELNNLNVVSIMIEFHVHTTLGKIIRKLIEMKEKDFSSQYATYIVELEKYLDETSSHTIESKRERLRQRPKVVICKTCKDKLSS